MNPAKVIYQTSDFLEDDLAALDNFVVSQDNGSFFQSGSYFRFIKLVEDQNPALVLARDGRGNIIGSLLGVLLKEGPGLKGYLSRRCIVSGGPLAANADQEIAAGLMSCFDKQVMPKAIYSQFRNLFDMVEYNSVILGNGYEFEEHLNYHIDLTKSDAEIWNGIHSKRRNEIRRAEREGTQVRLAFTDEECDTSYTILREVYMRARLPLPGKSFFNSARTLAGSPLKIFLATYKDKIIGTMYTLCFNKVIYDWYAGSFAASYDKYPNDLLPWAVFKWGMENGYEKFDFGGAGKPGVPYGVRDYKKKFGGQQVNFGRYQRINKPILFFAGKTALSVYRYIKR